MSLAPPSSFPRFLPVGLVLFFVFLLAAIFIFFPPRPVFAPGVIQHCLDLDRSSYGLSPAVFNDLPPIPKCFNSLIGAFRDSMFVDINFFDESYYLQPEFYQSFSTIGLSAWKSPAHTHYGAVGFGSFPQTSSSIITSSSPRSFTFLVYSGFGIRSLQRMALVARFENPDDAKLVSFDLDDLSESGFLLGPTFPKFSPDWVHRAELTILSTPPSFSRPIVILVSTVRAAASFDDARVSTLPYFDSTDFVGEKVVYRLVLSPPSS